MRSSTVGYRPHPSSTEPPADGVVPGSTPASSGHVAALDGLRGIAVAAVVAYHLRPEWVPGGFLGVDLFFVLSGYLITSLLLEERAATGRIDLRGFAGRRLRRLLPAMVLVVVAVTLDAALHGSHAQVEQTRRHALAALGYVANWVFIADGDSYFSWVVEPSTLRHVWSLAIEEQFYLVWPVTVWGAHRLGGRRGVGIVAGVVVVASAWWMAARFTGGDPARVYYGTDTRAFEPLLGALLAVLLPLRATAPRWVRGWGAVAFTVWVGAVVIVDDTWTGFYEGGALVLAGAAGLVVLGAASPGRFAESLSRRPLVALGAISYGVYLWHWPVLIVVRRADWPAIPSDAAIVLVTLVLATVSARVVERPVREGRGVASSFVGGWRPVGAAVVTMVSVGAWVVVTTALVPHRGLTTEEAIASLVADGPATVVLLGDSSGWTLGGGEIGLDTRHGPFVSPFDGERIALVNMARKGYRLVPGATTDVGGVRPRSDRDVESEQWWREVVADVEPDVVVVVLGLSDLQSRDVDGRPVAFGSPAFDRAFLESASALFDDLTPHAPVVLLTTPPLLGEDMPRADMARFFDERTRDRAGHLNRLFGELAAASPRITVVDLAGWLCPSDGIDGEPCRRLPSGGPVRFDGVHYSAEGAAFAAEHLTEPLLAAVVSNADDRDP